MSQPPPPPSRSRSEPTPELARYLSWMERRNTPVLDVATEAVALRVGGWGFFAHGGGPGQSLDRVALDAEGRALERGDRGDWYAFLTTPGLDASGAVERLAWLYSAIPLAERPATLAHRDQAVTLEGFLAFPPETGRVMRLTLIAQPGSARLTFEPAG